MQDIDLFWVIIASALLFLMQAGMTFQTSKTDSYREKRIFTLGNILCSVLFAALFFWFVDLESDNIFTTLLGPKK